MQLEATNWFSAGHTLFIYIKEPGRTHMTGDLARKAPRGGFIVRQMRCKIQGPSFAQMASKVLDLILYL